MATLGDLLYRLLDFLTFSDQQANHNRVIKEGLVIRGEWEPGRLFVHGEELEPADWADREKPWGQLRDPTPKWRWGPDATDNRAAARAILEWFLDEPEVEAYLDEFAEHVVARLPQDDFEVTFNYERFRNHLLVGWSWGTTDQPTGDHLAEMGGSDYVIPPDSGELGD